MFKKLSALFLIGTISLFLGGCTFAGYTITLPNIPFLSSLFTKSSNSKTEAEITYWSLFEPYSVYETSIVDYQNKNPHIKVNFEQRAVESLDTYKDSLLATLKLGKSVPDIIRIHASWVEDFKDYLEPAPTKIITVENFNSRFYKPASDIAILDNKIYAIPLHYDSLALLYNKDIFVQKNATPPSTWSDFSNLAGELTVVKNNKIVTAGAAIGSAENVAHFSDILGLLINQTELSLPDDIDSDLMSQIVVFYTNFITARPVWDREFAYSPLAFSQGKVAMMFAPSWQLLNILALNPNLNIGVAPVPQNVADSSLTTGSFPNFWVEAVPKKSKNTEASWEFLSYLASSEVQQETFNSAQLQRAFGEPYSDASLQESMAANPYLGAFYTNASNGKILKITDLSGNSNYVNVFKTVIEGVLNGGNVNDLLKTAKQEYTRLENTN